MSIRPWITAAIVCGMLAAAAPARAQQAAPVQLIPDEKTPPIKHHATFTLSGGFDLDVIGSIVTGALGQKDDAQLAIRQTLPWPDLFVTLPKRAEFSAAFGVFEKDEAVVRLSKASYAADPLTDAGNFAGRAGDGVLTLQLSEYREQSWEIGFRHYLMNKSKAKQYANLMYGRRDIDAMSMRLSAPSPIGPIGTFRLYEKSSVPTFSLEVGMTWEFGHVGVFGQVGGRWVSRMKRDDTDL